MDFNNTIYESTLIEPSREQPLFGSECDTKTGKSAFHVLLKSAAEHIDERPMYLVFENVEQILGQNKYLDHIVSYIFATEANFWISNSFRIGVVGTQEFSSIVAEGQSDIDPLRNRLKILNPIGPLSLKECIDLVNIGMSDELQIRSDISSEEIGRQIYWHCGGHAQRVQEICLEICREVLERGRDRVDKSILDRVLSKTHRGLL
ncbi:hypothetical protein P1J78_24830 [Psychromarinibacter sp. C21-152]|uniref:Uncharacterized protein n=1 Tax=Psychromarinibacter sediminicola TaxID=3033385 RepID=A0AAE3TCR4_9RHOB|nr:hypothetical protein [Psychromarinibacter sediminicola]MDF0603940.1 hypothetical protein [Psychromarinibacter sediminicola]